MVLYFFHILGPQPGMLILLMFSLHLAHSAWTLQPATWQQSLKTQLMYHLLCKAFFKSIKQDRACIYLS